VAIEINRTPVLKGAVTAGFIQAVENSAKFTSGQQVRIAIEKSKKILSAYKKKVRLLSLVLIAIYFCPIH
jgi:hypothetical protein